MKSPSILLVEDDAELSALMEEFLSAHGLAVTAAHDGEQGLSRALEGSRHEGVLDPRSGYT